MRRRPRHAPVAARQEPDPAPREGARPALLDAGDDPRAGRREARAAGGGRGAQASPCRALPRGRALGQPRMPKPRASSATTSSSPSATTCEQRYVGARDGRRRRRPGARRRARELLGDEPPEEGIDWAVTAAEQIGRAASTPASSCARCGFRAACRTSSGRLDESDVSWERALAIARTSATSGRSRCSSTGSRTPRYGGGIRVACASSPRRASRAIVAPAIPEGRGAGADLPRLGRRSRRAISSRRSSCCRRARAQAAEGRFRWWEAGNLANIGAVSLGLGRLDDARTSAREALSISQAMRDRRGVVYELSLLAEIAAAAGDARLRGTLVGAVEAEERGLQSAGGCTSWAREPARRPAG